MLPRRAAVAVLLYLSGNVQLVNQACFGQRLGKTQLQQGAAATRLV
jgi:hypothetical protein